MVPEQGPGMQVTSGAVGTFRFENVCVPEQLLKLYPTAIVVRTSSEDTVKLIVVPCAVLPLHWPTLSDETDGDVGPLPHPEASTAAKVPTHPIAFFRVHIATRFWAIPVSVRLTCSASGARARASRSFGPRLSTRPGRLQAAASRSTSRIQPAGEGRLALPGWQPSQQTVDGNVFIERRPVNADAGSDQFPPLSFGW